MATDAPDMAGMSSVQEHQACCTAASLMSAQPCRVRGLSVLHVQVVGAGNTLNHLTRN